MAQELNFTISPRKEGINSDGLMTDQVGSENLNTLVIHVGLYILYHLVEKWIVSTVLWLPACKVSYRSVCRQHGCSERDFSIGFAHREF